MIHRHSQPGQARMGEVGPEPSVDPKMAQIRQLQAAELPWETPWILGQMLRIQEKHMDQYLLIPFVVGWTSIYQVYQLFWGSPGVHGFDPSPYHEYALFFRQSHEVLWSAKGRTVSPCFTYPPRLRLHVQIRWNDIISRHCMHVSQSPTLAASSN